MASVLDQLGIQGGALLVNIVGFLLLLYLMRRFAFKPVGDFMQQRADRIKADLTEARQLRDEAENRHRHLQSELQNARDQFRAEMARASREAKDAIAQLHVEARAQREQIIVDAETQLQHSRETMLEQLREQVTELAAEVAARLLRDTLTDERQTALVEAFIADIDRLALEDPHDELVG